MPPTVLVVLHREEMYVAAGRRVASCGMVLHPD